MAPASKKVSFAAAAAAAPAKPKTASTLLPTEHTTDFEAAEEDGDDDAEMSFEREPLDAPRSPLRPDADMVMLDSASLAPPQAAVATTSAVAMDVDGALKFPAAKDAGVKIKSQVRRVPIPPHRMTPLKRDWVKLYAPLVEECGLQVRMNVKRRAVELKTSSHTPSPANTILQKACDFLSAYTLGFAAEDALALLRMDELYVETFEIKDVKTLHGDHLSRAIGRIAGKDGRTRFTIENASRTRIILADTKIHILGSFGAIKIARDAVCALILGSPPGKVYGAPRPPHPQVLDIG